MYGLPPSTIINRPLYKKVIFEKFNLKTAERDRFDADVSKMSLVAYVSMKKIPALGEGKEVVEFYVLQVILKHREYDAQNILLLGKLIPQHILFALQYENETQICVFHVHLHVSKWKKNSEILIPICGLSLDDVWHNIIAQIGNLDVDSSETLDQQIIRREQRKKLLQQIELIENRCRMEKRKRKKYEMYQQIIKMKEILNNT